jgi:hypothetical protein
MYSLRIRLTRIVCELISRKVLLLLQRFYRHIFAYIIGSENGGKREAYPPLIHFCLISDRTVNLELVFVIFINFLKDFESMAIQNIR